ncbi:hypothetical protein ETTORE_0412 [Pseudomonas phage Ettore]|nr:hypothetical protein ETTORE_0412 [Pseudomonas phage Ettore]
MQATSCCPLLSSTTTPTLVRRQWTPLLFVTSARKTARRSSVSAKQLLRTSGQGTSVALVIRAVSPWAFPNIAAQRWRVRNDSTGHGEQTLPGRC